MRIFLSHLISFTVIGYYVMTALDVGLSRMASSSHYGATECWENLMKGRIDADCVILVCGSVKIPHISQMGCI